jgi:hypothetical protein
MFNKPLTFFIIAILMSLFFSNSIIGHENKHFAYDMYNAFVLQSRGETRLAFYTFKKAYDRAVIAGESTKKLCIINDMFIWYRKHGWSSGIMFKSSNCIDEEQCTNYEKNDFSNISSYFSRKLEYTSEFGKTPEQSKNIREFLLGIGELISGIFGIAVIPFPTPLWTVSFAVAFDGTTRIYSSLNTTWSENEKRMLELKQIKNNLNKITKQ